MKYIRNPLLFPTVCHCSRSTTTPLSPQPSSNRFFRVPLPRFNMEREGTLPPLPLPVEVRGRGVCEGLFDIILQPRNRRKLIRFQTIWKNGFENPDESGNRGSKIFSTESELSFWRIFEQSLPPSPKFADTDFSRPSSRILSLGSKVSLSIFLGRTPFRQFCVVYDTQRFIKRLSLFLCTLTFTCITLTCGFPRRIFTIVWFFACSSRKHQLISPIFSGRIPSLFPWTVDKLHSTPQQ